MRRKRSCHKKKEGKENTYKYLVPTLSAISIGVTVVVALLILNLQSRALDELAEVVKLGLDTIKEVQALKTEEVLQPVVVFNTVRDENKEAHEIYADSERIREDVNLEAYGDDGFRVIWKKEKNEWLSIKWELNRKNYEETYRYLLYFRVKADKKQRIAITLTDDEGRFIQETMWVGDEVTREIIPLASLNKYWKTEKGVTVSQDNFNWHSVKEVKLLPYYDDKVDNTVYFEKMILLIAR